MNGISEILMAAKDFSGKYTKINSAALSDMGYKRGKDVIGRHEFDMAEELYQNSIGGTQSLAEQFLKEDEMVFRGKELNILCAHVMRGKLRFFIVNKHPCRNEKGKIFAATYVGVEVINPPLELLISHLTLKKENRIISEPSKKHIQWYMDDFLKNIILNSRELECVNLLAIGNTAKAIARQLGLSHRTVEFYLDNAKNKLDCTNSHELIAKCFAKGWIGIPEELANF